MSKITITLEYDQKTGGMSFSGPLENKLVCYGMLELAREAVSHYETPLKIEKPGSDDVRKFSVAPRPGVKPVDML